MDDVSAKLGHVALWAKPSLRPDARPRRRFGAVVFGELRLRAQYRSMRGRSAGAKPPTVFAKFSQIGRFFLQDSAKIPLAVLSDFKGLQVRPAQNDSLQIYVRSEPTPRPSAKGASGPPLEMPSFRISSHSIFENTGAALFLDGQRPCPV